MKVWACNSALYPKEILVPSQRTQDTYRLVTPSIFNDPICTCPGWHYRQTCKHITALGNVYCGYVWHKTSADEPKPDHCPRCGEEVHDFELKGEL